MSHGQRIDNETCLTRELRRQVAMAELARVLRPSEALFRATEELVDDFRLAYHDVARYATLPAEPVVGEGGNDAA